MEQQDVRRNKRCLALLHPTSLALSVVGALAPAEGHGQQAAGCNYSAAAPIALDNGVPRHTLLLFWAGESCNAAVAGRAVLDADGHAIYMFIEDPNRLRIKEPDVPPLPTDYVPPLAQAALEAAAALERTAAIGDFPADTDAGVYPRVEATEWKRAREADLPMMCHATGYSVQACVWLHPASGRVEVLLERGS